MDDFTKCVKEMATSNVYLPPTSRSGFTPQRHILYALFLNKLVILEGWKAQSLSAQNHSMAAGGLWQGFFERLCACLNCILSNRHV